MPSQPLRPVNHCAKSVTAPSQQLRHISHCAQSATAPTQSLRPVSQCAQSEWFTGQPLKWYIPLSLHAPLVTRIVHWPAAIMVYTSQSACSTRNSDCSLTSRYNGIYIYIYIMVYIYTSLSSIYTDRVYCSPGLLNIHEDSQWI